MKQWDLTEQSLRDLLAFLDPDADRAPAQYEKIREKLIRFFEWKGCIPGDEYADETIDRVARRVAAGIETPPGNPYLFFHGVAVNVIRERWRKAARDPKPIETLTASESPVVQPFEFERKQSDAEDAERRLSYLLECLDRLPPASRELLETYHLQGTGVRIGRRKGLAERLNIPAGALRLRVYRLRRQLERCLARSMAGKHFSRMEH